MLRSWTEFHRLSKYSRANTLGLWSRRDFLFASLLGLAVAVCCRWESLRPRSVACGQSAIDITRLYFFQ